MATKTDCNIIIYYCERRFMIINLRTLTIALVVASLGMSSACNRAGAPIGKAEQEKKAVKPSLNEKLPAKEEAVVKPKSNNLEKEPPPIQKKWPYQFVGTKTEKSGNNDVMDLYAYSDKIDTQELVAFCRERKRQSTAKAFYYLVIFDKPGNAVFPNNPFTATFNEEEETKHVRAIYCYNKLNGFSELDVYEENMWDSTPKTSKP